MFEAVVANCGCPILSSLPRRSARQVLRFKRVAGDLAQYKALCSTLLADMRL